MIRLIDATEFEHFLLRMGEDNICDDCLRAVLSAMDEQPTIDAEPVIYAHWVEEPWRHNHWHCSNCHEGWGYISKFMKRCPNCGAIFDTDNTTTECKEEQNAIREHSDQCGTTE